MLKAAADDPAIKRALVEIAGETEREVIEPFFDWKHNGRPAGNGWNRSTNNARFGVDYFNRTGTAKSNMFDNKPEETQCFYTNNESLDGANHYEITFAPGQEPPDNGFWSLTLYTSEHFFYPNDLKRYSLGTKNQGPQARRRWLARALRRGPRRRGKARSRTGSPRRRDISACTSARTGAKRASSTGRGRRPPFGRSVNTRQIGGLRHEIRYSIESHPRRRDCRLCQPPPRRRERPSIPSRRRTIAKDAYIFTYPLVMNYRTMYSQAIKGDAAFGKWLHLKLSTPGDTDIVTPNNDTPYSYAWIDLRAEPWVKTMPKIQKEAFLHQPVGRPVGLCHRQPRDRCSMATMAGNYLLASPSWQGDMPKGIKRVIRGESDILGTLTRTQAIGDEKDLLKVEQIQRGYKLQPLSEFLGRTHRRRHLPSIGPHGPRAN